MVAIKSFILAVATLAFSAAAAPAGSSGFPSDITVEQAASMCGAGEKINCCNGKNSSGDKGGLLGTLLGSSGQCSPLIDLRLLLSDACASTVACCSGEQVGLITCSNLLTR
jgi:hypothetical protein